MPPCQRQAGSSLVCTSADAGQGFGVHLIHEEPDHTVAVLALSWLPNRGAPPHDHGTWAVVAGVDGPEKNEFFERTDDRSRPGHAELKKIGEKVCGVGDVVALPKGTIHSVWNETDGVTLSLHIYGKHINFTGRSQFDLKTQTETPFVVKMQNRVAGWRTLQASTLTLENSATTVHCKRVSATDRHR